MGNSPQKTAILNSIRSLAQADGRIRHVLIDEGIVTRSGTYSLTASCGVFVSLHRAEGFGSGMPTPWPRARRS